MFKKITTIITIALISVIMLSPAALGRGGGGRGGRGGGMMGGGMMGGQMDTAGMMGGRGFNQPAIDVNGLKNSKLLTYLVDANGVKVDPNSLSNEVLQSLYMQIARGDQTVIDTTRFNSLSQVAGTIMGQPNISDPNDPDPMIAVQLNGLTINPIIDLLIRWTGKAVLPSNEALGMTLTVYSPERMKQSEALNLLYSAMRQQGFVAETRNNIIYIRPGTTKFVDLLPDDADLTLLNPQEEFRKVFRVKHYSASTMGQLILPFVNPTGSVVAEETTQTVMVTDTAEVLVQVQKIIDKFDNALAGTVTKILKVQHNDPVEIADMIATVMANNITSSGMLGGYNMGGMGGMMGGMQQQGNRGQQQNRNQPQQTRGQQQTRTATNNRNAGRTATTTGMMGMGMFGAASASASTIGTGKPEPTLTPDSVKKIIIATATPEDMNKIEYWLGELDTEAKVIWNPGNLIGLDKNQVVQKVYYLQYNTPDRLAQILQPLLTQNGYLTAEQDTGTLLIRDTVATLTQLEDIIKEFDKEQSNPQDQQIFIVEKGDPREIVNIINTILSGSGSATGTTGTRTTGMTGTRTTGMTGTRTTGTRTTGTTGMRTTGR